MFVSGPVFLFQKVENQHMTVPAGIVSQNLERMKIKPENGGIAMKTWSKRIGLILFFSLWAAAGLQIWAKKQEGKEKEATAVFAKLSLEDQNGIVQYYGKLKTEKQVQMLERREEYLRNLARRLGISSHIVISPHMVKTVRQRYCKKKAQMPIQSCDWSPGERKEKLPGKVCMAA